MQKGSLILILISTLLVSCSTYRQKGLVRTVVRGPYSELDTLHLKSFILCNSQDYSLEEGFTFSPRKRVTPINEDSIINIFKNSLTKLNMHVNFAPDNENHCDTAFHRNYPVRIGRIDNERIKEMAFHDENRTTLIPFIRINQRTHVRVQGSPATNSVINKVSFLTLTIMVVQNDEITYRKAYEYSIGQHVEEKTDPYPKIEQIHWDNLVRLAMEDYLERMK